MRTLISFLSIMAMAAAAPGRNCWFPLTGCHSISMTRNSSSCTWAAPKVPMTRAYTRGAFCQFRVHRVTKEGVTNELPPATELKKIFEAAGISDDSKVILYGEGSVLLATRTYFTLDYLGTAAAQRSSTRAGKMEGRRQDSRERHAYGDGREFHTASRPEVVVESMRRRISRQLLRPAIPWRCRCWTCVPRMNSKPATFQGR